MKTWVCLLAAVLLTIPVNAEETRVAIALHGGAGTIERARMTSEQELRYRKFLDAAIEEGYRQLKAGEPGLDVVVSIIQRMEDSPLFNAGRGSVYTWEGHHELDASIMHGLVLDAGAVAGVKTVKSPIALARAVMERSPHVMLASEGLSDLRLSKALKKHLKATSIQSVGKSRWRHISALGRQGSRLIPITNMAPSALLCLIAKVIWSPAHRPAV